jgi:hypothetical protein
MKRLTIIAVIIFALSVLNLAQTSGSDDRLKAELVNIEKQSWVAWQKRDGSFYETFLSDDHVEVGGNGTASKKEVVGFVGSPVCVVRSYALDSFNVTILNADSALLVYHAVQDTTCNGKPVPSPAWVSSLYVRRDGKWLNAMYQQTPTPVK